MDFFNKVKQIKSALVYLKISQSNAVIDARDCQIDARYMTIKDEINKSYLHIEKFTAQIRSIITMSVIECLLHIKINIL